MPNPYLVSPVRTLQTYVCFWGVISTGRCNTSVKSFGWGFKPQRLAWPFVELARHFIQMRLAVHGQVGPFREVLPEQAIGVLVGTALPWASRIAEVNIDVGRQILQSRPVTITSCARIPTGFESR